MELTTLRYFATAAEAETLSAAARQVHVSQPAMSAAVERLEQELGVRLIERHRGRGSTRLTRAGERVLRGAKRVLREADRLLQDLLAWEQLSGGELHVGAGTVAVEHFLPVPIASLTRQYPKLQVVIHEGRSQDLLVELADGALDVAVVTGPVRSPDLRVVASVEDPFLCVASPELANLPDGPQPAREVLATHRLISYGPGDLQDQIDVALAGVGIRQTSDRLVIRSGEAVKQYVAAGLGVGMVSGRGAKTALNDGRLLEILLSDLRIVREYEVVRRTEHLPAVDAFVEAVQKAWSGPLPTPAEFAETELNP